jgi:hypothetical protein
MIAVNIVLMVLVLVMLAGLLAWAIGSDRASKRAAGGAVPPSDKPLHHNLVMPHEMRGGRVGNLSRKDRSRSARA